MAPGGLSRRQLLGGGALLVAAYASAFLWGHRPAAAMAGPFLSPGPRATLEAALVHFLPAGADVREVAEGVDGFLASHDPLLGEQLKLALVALEHLGAGGLFTVRFSRLEPARRAAILEAWARSRLGIKRQIHQAMRKVALFSWYARPDTWAALGYDGPWVKP